MEKSSTESKEKEVKFATPAQVKLAKQLYEETNYSRQYNEAELALLTREAISKHIHVLKESKVRDQALRAVNDRVPQFDKIGFGMVYKKVWTACAEMPLATKPSQADFEDRVIGEYTLFKRVQNACRKHVQEGGLQ